MGFWASWIARFAADRSGNVVVISALTLPFLLGFVGLSVEYGNGLLTQVENQRVADLASYAGAVAYSETQSEDAMTVAAQRIAALNGIVPAALSVALAVSPRDGKTQVVQASVTTTNRMILTPLLGVDPELSIAAVAYASVGEKAGNCILALDPDGTGITLNGGVRISAYKCAIASNATVVAPCGTEIVADGVTYDGNVPPRPCRWANNVKNGNGDAISIAKAHTNDPLAGNEAVNALVEHIADIRGQAGPAGPFGFPGTGQDIVFGGAASPSDTAAQLAAAGCTYDPSYYSPWWTNRWVVSCGATINAGSLKVNGGISVDFNVSSGLSTTYYFAGSIINEGSSLSFGDGNFIIRDGVRGATVSFGSGSFHIGRAVGGCAGSDFGICASGTVSFDGPSAFTLESGVYVDGGGKLTLGDGTDNTYAFGASSSGDAIRISGGATLKMADAIGGSDTFRVTGDVNGGGGGSCIVFPVAEHHDIAGNVHLAGGARLGAGVYTIDGYFLIDTGGAACDGGTAVQGEDVTIVISGSETPTGWSCNGVAFCISGGNAVTLTAPSGGKNANLAVIGPVGSGITAGASLSAGGQAHISGAFYFPQGQVELSGGAGLGDADDDCLQLIGSSVILSGGTKTASECVASAGSGGKVGLVQ